MSLPDFPPSLWAAIVLVTILAGVVKGATGFAMPMVMISGLGSLLPPELALASLILPTLVTNIVQALRNGLGAALGSIVTHRRYLLIVLVCIAFSAQLVAVLPSAVLYLFVGTPVTVFALIQLAGVRLTIPPRRRLAAEFAIGGFAGIIGGVSGVWGPPTVMYLNALDTPKVDHLRAQGILYGLGAVVLTLAHIRSGVLSATTAPLSALLVLPGLAGIAAGFQIVDRLDQRRFRQATLVVLVIAGLNLVRRGLAA